MSAGFGKPESRVSNDLSLLAPKFAASVLSALAECRVAGLPAIVFEAFRSQQLQALYYARGRTIIPPHHTVTNAPTSLHSWHGYGLAVDVVHETRFWEPAGGEAWFRSVAAIFKKHDCAWGGDWTHPDTPHFQWHLCKPSPSPEAQRLLLAEGREAVWRAVNAAP